MKNILIILFTALVAVSCGQKTAATKEVIAHTDTLRPVYRTEVQILVQPEETRTCNSIEELQSIMRELTKEISGSYQPGCILRVAPQLFIQLNQRKQVLPHLELMESMNETWKCLAKDTSNICIMQYLDPTKTAEENKWHSYTYTFVIIKDSTWLGEKTFKTMEDVEILQDYNIPTGRFTGHEIILYLPPIEFTYPVKSLGTTQAPTVEALKDTIKRILAVVPDSTNKLNGDIIYKRAKEYPDHLTITLPKAVYAQIQQTFVPTCIPHNVDYITTPYRDRAQNILYLDLTVLPNKWQVPGEIRIQANNVASSTGLISLKPEE